MRANRILLLLILLTNVSFSQYLKGKVADVSSQPLSGATIYFDGTTISTLTNENGEFSIAYDSKLNRPLVVSYIGYQTVYIQDYNSQQPLSVVLEVAVNSLKEVVIKKNRFSRKEMMQVFKERFLGKTSYGRKSSIQNEDDIEFEYDEKLFKLIAYSDKPLIIINPSLGYKITYELVDFEVRFSHLAINSESVRQSYYAGLSRFDEWNTSPKSVKNREKAFKGSSLQFFRNLINGIWGKDDFKLFEKGYLVNPSDHFTVTFEEDKYKVSVKKQKFDNKKLDNIIAIFGLLYDNSERSQIQFNAETIYVDYYGNNLSLKDVAFSGEISIKCVGDMLPLNYGM